MQCVTHGCVRKGHQRFRGQCAPCYGKQHVPVIERARTVTIRAPSVPREYQYTYEQFELDVDRLYDWLLACLELTRKEQNLLVFAGNRSAKQLTAIREKLILELHAVEYTRKGHTKSTQVLQLIGPGL